MADTLGEKLRAAREARGVTISEVAEQTRIAPMYIECIENDNYKPLPGGIFNKGFVKSYARFIGYDEQQALGEYNSLLSQTEGNQEDHTKTYRPEVLTDDRASQSTLPTLIFAGIILALMTGGILFLVNYLQSKPSSDPIATNTSTTDQTQPEPSLTPIPPAGAAPTMQTLKVEFRTATEPISLRATSDGKTSENIVTPGTAQTFEPRESLRLSYSKSLASSAQLFINGKQITLPSQPANPKRVPIELEINAANLGQIWTAGAISFDAPAAPSTVGSQSTSPSNSQAVRPSTPTPAPRTTPATANAARPRSTQTPIVVGGNRNAARPSPN